MKCKYLHIEKQAVLTSLVNCLVIMTVLATKWRRVFLLNPSRATRDLQFRKMFYLIVVILNSEYRTGLLVDHPIKMSSREMLELQPNQLEYKKFLCLVL